MLFKTVKELKEIITENADLISKYNLILLNGPLGVGKTTFVKIYSKLVGVKTMVNSPTFSIINKYLINNSSQIIHIDAYRLSGEDIGLDEMLLQEDTKIFIEWSEKIRSYIPKSNYLEITLDYNINDNTREISILEVK